MKLKTSTLNADGTWTHEELDLGDTPELDQMLADARTYWDELKAAGTPYWCIHEGRGVDHPRAYWKRDTPNAKIHRKHGVMCIDCRGYIQEG